MMEKLHSLNQRRDKVRELNEARVNFLEERYPVLVLQGQKVDEHTHEKKGFPFQETSKCSEAEKDGDLEKRNFTE